MRIYFTLNTTRRCRWKTLSILLLLKTRARNNLRDANLGHWGTGLLVLGEALAASEHHVLKGLVDLMAGLESHLLNYHLVVREIFQVKCKDK